MVESKVEKNSDSGTYPAEVVSSAAISFERPWSRVTLILALEWTVNYRFLSMVGLNRLKNLVLQNSQRESCFHRFGWF